MHNKKEDVIRMGLTPKPVIPSQHRRAEWANYRGQGLYMVTLCIDGRAPLFGQLEGDFRAQRGSAGFPHIVPSALGRAVLNDELPKIHAVYPEVELWQAALMPDHLHLLLYIRRPLPEKKRLGTVIGAFMGGCSRAWWRLSAAALPAADAAGTPAAVVPAASAAGKRRPLFEQGYHDRIIKRPGMLDAIKRYMADNPLRAIMRRNLPALLERRLHLRVAGRDYAAFGCLFLLKRAEKEQVFYHRKDSKTGLPTEQTADFAASRDRQLAEGRQGVVLVSPAVSIPERIVINAAIDEGLPVIHLQKEAITPFWKPERRRFEACARGALLILAPWGLDELASGPAADAAGTTAATGTTAAAGTTAAGTTANTAGHGAVVPGASAVGTGAGASDYARFHRLNDLAAEICATTDATLLGLAAFTR